MLLCTVYNTARKRVTQFDLIALVVNINCDTGNWLESVSFISMVMQYSRLAHYYSYHFANSQMSWMPTPLNHNIVIGRLWSSFITSYLSVRCNLQNSPKSQKLRTQDSLIIHEPCVVCQSWIWRMLLFSKSFISLRIRATLYRSSWNLDTGTWTRKQQFIDNVTQTRWFPHLLKHKIQRLFKDITGPIPSDSWTQMQHSSITRAHIWLSHFLVAP